MPTELLPTRTEARTRMPREPLTRSFWIALGIHGLLLGTVLAWSLVHFRSSHKFGSANPLSGSIQASMVHALPLPPRHPVVDKAVLASEKPNIAPPPPPPPAPPQPRASQPKTENKTKSEPAPRKDSVALTKPAAEKPAKAPPRPEARVQPDRNPPKTDPKPASKAPPEKIVPQPDRPAPTRPQPVPPTPKATTGETAGLQLPQSTTELRNGTATITVEERAFGERYAYYIRLISQKVNQSRASEEPDPPDARGKRTVIRFTIDRDGTPIEAEVQTRSGSVALDRSALRAIQRIDGFGPLPAGDHLTVDFGFTDH